jgi:hypothetical protein
MKKILLSLAVVAGFAVSAQTNSIDSKNDTIAGGYVFNFADLTAKSDSFELNCVQQVLNTLGGEGLSADIVSVEGNKPENKALAITYDKATANPYLSFTTGNCATMSGSDAFKVDVSNFIETGKLKVKVKSSADIKAFQAYPMGVDTSNRAVAYNFYNYLADDAKGVDGQDTVAYRWIDPISLKADEWAVWEMDLGRFSLQDDTVAMDGKGLIGVQIAASYWDNALGMSVFEDATFTIDWITVGDEDLYSLSSEKLDFVAEGFNVYPNPASDVLNIKFDANFETSVNLMDLTGKIVATQNAQAGAVTTAFQIADLNAGIYFVNVKSANGSATQKVVIK